MLIRIFQLIIVLIPCGIFVWLARIELVPSGVFRIQHDVHASSPFIDPLAPEDRVEDGETIVGDPVYFFAHPHRHFDRVAFEIWFQNTTTPVVEFGGLMQTKPDIYELQPLHNLLIDELDWAAIEEGELTLHQKTTQYDSLEEFYANPPPRHQVAVYKAEYEVPFRLTNYVPSVQERSIDVTLRGRHEFKTYIKNETLNLRLLFMDMNRDEGADPVVVTVFDERGRPVAESRADDDGDSRADAIASEMRSITLEAAGLPEGVYKIAFNASRDIFVRSLKTTQNKFVVMNAIYVGDEVAYRDQPRPADLWTNSQRFRAQTRHASGIQTITQAENVYEISGPYELFVFETDGSLDPIHVPQGDLEMFFDGPVAFFQDQFFQPDPIAIRPYTDIEQQGIAFILTRYQSPEQVGEWLVQTVEFDAAPLVFDKKAWKFTFSTPGIEEEQGNVLIKSINAIWTRKPFEWSDLWKK